MASEETSSSGALSAENQRNERRAGQSWDIFPPCITPRSIRPPGSDLQGPFLLFQTNCRVYLSPVGVEKVTFLPSIYA